AGVSSTDDPLWASVFERAYAASRFSMPFYAALGNHDHRGDVRAQVEYSAKSTRWRMPAPYYSFVRELSPDDSVEFFVLDPTPIRSHDPSAAEQVRWLSDRLERSRAIWRVVVGHHPIVSGGAHGGSDVVSDAIRGLLVAHGVNVYVSGHDHDLQL